MQLSRRAFFGASATAISLGEFIDTVLAEDVSRASAPSNLKITDMRVASLKGVPHRSSIIRIDTNQAISGWGEVRDGASPNYALMLKSRLLGENPCDVDRLFRKIKQFGGHGRQGGGVSAVEMALWDLAGKAYGLPVYRLLGGKFRDRVRIYADTPQPTSEVPFADVGREIGRRLKHRQRQGITWLKCDLGIGLLSTVPGTVSQPYGLDYNSTPITNAPFAGIEVTDKGIDLLSGLVNDIRDAVGPEIPLAIDHLGPLSVNSAIRLARRLERYSLAWIEDVLPWHLVEQLRDVTNSVTVPTLTGEDIYLKSGFQPLIERHAVDMIHPDLATAGGILETRKIGDLAGEHAIPMVLHCAGAPIQFMASVHCAAASENFLCLEHHGLDCQFWEELGQGLARPLVRDGFVEVPDTPGLGVDLNEDVARDHLERPGFFEPTLEWDVDRSWDRTWS